MKYTIYARKSSEAKEKQAVSIPDQIAECQECAHTLSIDCSPTPMTESKSAFKPHNRPVFDRMIELIESGDIEAILTWKPDRLCRNPEEGGKILQLLQDGKLKEIRTATGEIYSQESDHLILQIHFGMANQYSRNLSQNVRRGLKHKIERGQYPRPPLTGYIGYGERGQRNIKPDPLLAPLVRESYELMSTGNYSLHALLRIMEKKGITTRLGKHVSKSHFHEILTNPTFYGYIRTHGAIVKGDFEPIIDKPLFDKVQEVFNRKTVPRKNLWIDHHEYNGLMRCGECDSSITTTVKKKYYKTTKRSAEYVYHHCSHRKGKCSQGTMMTNDLDKLLKKEISKIAIDSDVWQLGIKLLKSKHGEETKRNADHLHAFQGKFGLLQDKLNRLISMRADGELSKDEFLVQKQLLTEEQDKVQRLMRDSEKSARTWLELAEEFLDTAYKAKEVMEGSDVVAKRNLIMTVGENLLLKDKKLDISFKQPYDILLKPSYRSDVLRD